MTEERQASNSSISMLHSMLNRLKSSERIQSSSHATAQHCRHSKDKHQCDRVFIPESDKPEWNFAGSNPSEHSVKPEEQNDADVDSEYFTQRTVFQESSPTSITFLKSTTPSNLLHSLTRDASQDLQPSESNPSQEEVKEEQTSQAESHFNILKKSPPHGPFTHDPTGSSLANSEPRFVKGTTVPMEYKIMKQPCRSENTVTSVEEAEPPPLPPKLRHLNNVHGQLQRTFTLKDFKLDLEPINLLEEICTGEEWAKFLPVKDSPPQTDAKDYSQTEDSHHSNDDIGSQNAVIKPGLSADKEQSEIGSSPASITDSQEDRVIQVRQGTSDSPISAFPKTPIRNVTVTQRTSDMPEYERFKAEENDLVVMYLHDENDLTKVKNMPLDLSVVKSSGVLDNSALKSRIQLSKKRKHQPTEKRKKGKTQMDFLHQRSASTESFQSPPSSHTSVFASSKFYILPCSKFKDSQTHEDSQISVLGNEKALVRNAAVLQRISEVPEAYSNDNDIAEVSVLYKNKQLSYKMRDMPLDFSVVKSSGVLDNSALKDRIQLSKKRKHRPPGKRKNESFQSDHSSHPSIFTSSAFHNLLRSCDSNDSQTSVPEKQKTKERLLKPKLWKMKS
ncbi:uncharacterized protein si:dkey-9i23.6 [Pangasianodon hypophthalmus]|uniref:uncharacterized protein si:dkey-9i23.6 n=1 Tax=Pangasianodon hypophthalmus TaxID=310915 RepID=UPI002307EBE0|nr:uncharacterized protein si:dkey-9i23.6 [Pangasianodon hypophthalmus]